MAYNLSQLVNKTLYSKGSLNARAGANTDSEILYTFPPATYVGIIFSALENPDGVWLMVDRKIAGTTKTFFVKASAAGIDVDKLRDQGALTVQEEREKEIEENKTTGEKIYDKVKQAALFGLFGYALFRIVRYKTK